MRIASCTRSNGRVIGLFRVNKEEFNKLWEDGSDIGGHDELAASKDA